MGNRRKSTQKRSKKVNDFKHYKSRDHVDEADISSLRGLVYFTDGGCRKLRGHKLTQGGYGYCSLDERHTHQSIGYSDTTNNRMELKAIISVLEDVETRQEITILSDSQYCIKIIKFRMDRWIKEGKMDGKANLGLWERFRKIQYKHLYEGSTLHFEWVRGHNGTPGNEVADRLAGVAMNSSRHELCSDSN